MLCKGPVEPEDHPVHFVGFLQLFGCCKNANVFLFARHATYFFSPTSTLIQQSVPGKGDKTFEFETLFDLSLFSDVPLLCDILVPDL